MACTTILVGKNASYDGSTLVARNDDSPSGQFRAKKFTVVQPKEQPKVYKSVLSHVEIKLPSKPLRYTCMPNVRKDQGIWAAFGINELNVAMSATETITSNERVLGADPLVKYIAESGDKKEDNYQPEVVGGIGEEDMVTIVLPYIKSARDGVKRLGSLLEKYGTYEMNAIAFQDVDEIWWLETIGGHHWMARRVPDDAYVIMPNQLGLDHFNLEDAFGEQKEFMCSADLREFIKKHHLDLSLDGIFNPRDAFGSHSDADHVYNTPRAWVLQRYFNPLANDWDGVDAEFRPDDNDIPWFRIPDKKITIEDIKYALSNHFQGTEYDPYLNRETYPKAGLYRAIGVNRTDILGLTQIRPYMPEAIRSVEWIALGSNVFNAITPFYANINKTPDYMSKVQEEVCTDYLYWSNRLIAALADAHFASCIVHVERYQLAVQSKCHEIINKYDEKYMAGKYDKKTASKLCEEANEAIAVEVKKLTDKLLKDVLHTASCEMKNGFVRSDA